MYVNRLTVTPSESVVLDLLVYEADAGYCCISRTTYAHVKCKGFLFVSIQNVCIFVMCIMFVVAVRSHENGISVFVPCNVRTLYTC